MAPKLQHIRRKQASGEEPFAFRIYRHPNRDSSTFQPQTDQHLSTDTHIAPSSSQSVNDVLSSNLPAIENVSWLNSPKLTSASFNAHDFLQTNISHKYDKAATRTSHVHLLDDGFDADAALAAIDTVESSLRKQRHIARREEISARNELRDALHTSAKKREELLRASDTISTHISTIEDIGSKAANNLREDIAALKTSSNELANMQEARDLVMLLVLENTQLNAVHVSHLLSRAKTCIDNGSMDRVLTESEMKDAISELARCETELKTSIESWMQEGVDTDNTSLVRDCASAAMELGFSSQFIRKYISYAFSFNIDQIGQLQVMETGSEKEHDDISLTMLRNVCWDAANAVKEALPSIVECFPSPAEALAYFMHVVITKTVVTVGDKLLARLHEKIDITEGSSSYIPSEDGKSRNPAHSIRSEKKAISNSQKSENEITENESAWKKKSQPSSPIRKKYLNSFAETLKTIANLHKDLFDLYSSHGGSQVLREFSELPDPYNSFTSRHISTYLETEKAWLDDQLGVSFSEITRIELNMPRLAPREGSEPDAYHRYRVFYNDVCSKFPDMITSAVNTTHESILRMTTVMNTIFSIPVDDKYGDERSNEQSSEELLPHRGKRKQSTQHEFSSQISLQPTESSVTRDSAIRIRRGFSISQPTSAADYKIILKEALICLIMNYLAHAETILQAAIHLLPVREEDAIMHELWNAGGSPLTAYIMAVELLSQSNEILDKYLVTLECSHQDGAEEKPCSSLSFYLEDCISMETREFLQSELTTGLSDLGLEAQCGVRTAINCLKSRLTSIFKASNPKEIYCNSNSPHTPNHLYDAETSSRSSLDLVPSQPFIDVRSFLESQLKAISSITEGGNKSFILSQLSYIIKEAVLLFWVSFEDPISEAGALQLIADGKTMHQIFQGFGSSADVVECLSAVGQLFLESAEGLWGCVESRALASVDARTLADLLRKRRDFGSQQIVKVCQSLGANVRDLGAEAEIVQESCW